MKSLFFYFRRRPRQQLRLMIESLALPDAYACLRCQRVTEGLDNGRCKLCGSWQVLSVVEMLKLLEKEVARKLEKAEKKTPDRAATLRAMNTNLSLNLTAVKEVA